MSHNNSEMNLTLSSAGEIRQKFEKSDFFKKIATNEFGLNIAGNSGTFYGINSKQDKIISYGNNKLTQLCSRSGLL